MDNEFSYSQMMTDRWSELTGEQPDVPLRLSEQTLSRLREMYDEPTLRDYIYDSISAWIWSHRDEELKPFYANTSLTSESNSVRVGVYRVKGGSGKFSIGLKVGGEVMLNEVDWLFYLSLGELPDFEVFRPCPAWLAVSQTYGRKMADPAPLMAAQWAMGKVPFGKAYRDALMKLKDVNQSKAFLLNVAPSFEEAMFITLQGAGLAARGTTEEGQEVAFKGGAEKVFRMQNLAKRDRAYAALIGVDPEFLDGDVATAEDEWSSVDEGDRRVKGQVIGLLTEMVTGHECESHEED